MPTSRNTNSDVDVFEQATTELDNKSMIAPGEIILGTITSIDVLGQPMVDYPLNPEKGALKAITTLVLTSQQVSRQVALLFNQGDLSQPIVIGLVHSPLQAMLDNFQQDHETSFGNTTSQDTQVELAANLGTDDVSVDGNKITITYIDYDNPRN